MILDNIPQYLFRVASPRSDGETNETWVRSASACLNTGSSKEDIFFNLNNKKRADVAEILNVHLRWWPKKNLEDNFVSWTSSLLFAIQYIYYRHLSPQDGSSLAEIRIYVIDTTRFPRGTFIRDLDLIHVFCKFDGSLENLQSMRNSHDFYFGEYLSQGSLKIENKCQTIPAKIIFEQDRLRRIQPQFAELHHEINEVKPKWVKEVVRLRKAIWPYTELRSISLAEMLDRLEAIEKITQEVAPDWRFPIAIYFTALIGTESVEDHETEDDNVLFLYFRDQQVKGRFRPSEFSVIAPDTIPELKHVKQLLREVLKYLKLKKTLEYVRESEKNIHNLHLQNIVSENGHAFLTSDPNKMLSRIGQEVLSRLARIQMLCKEVTLAISSEEVGQCDPLPRYTHVGIQDENIDEEEDM